MPFFKLIEIVAVSVIEWCSRSVSAGGPLKDTCVVVKSGFHRLTWRDSREIEQPNRLIQRRDRERSRWACPRSRSIKCSVPIVLV